MPSARAGRARPAFGRSLLALALPVGALVGCVAPRPSVFVLLPEPSGSPGQITVSNTAGAQVIDQPGLATRVAAPGRAPEPPKPLTPAEIDRLFGDALAAQPGEPGRFVLYFKEDSDELTGESQALLPDVVRDIRARHAGDVGVVGHTDTVGTHEYNYRLGLRRAVRVADLLVALGVDRRLLDVTSHGKDDLLVPTGDGVPEPRNRRVEVTIR